MAKPSILTPLELRRARLLCERLVSGSRSDILAVVSERLDLVLGQHPHHSILGRFLAWVRKDGRNCPTQRTIPIHLGRLHEQKSRSILS